MIRDLDSPKKAAVVNIITSFMSEGRVSFTNDAIEQIVLQYAKQKTEIESDRAKIRELKNEIEGLKEKCSKNDSFKNALKSFLKD